MTLRLIPFLLLWACGDDTPEPMDDPEAGWAVPRTWGAGSQFGYAVVSIRTKLPSDLMMQHCFLDAQLATATSAGMLAESDTEGQCIVTAAADFVGVTPDPTPACAGQFAFVLSGSTRRYTVCPDTNFPNPFDLDCGELTGADAIQVTSGDDGVDGDVLLSLDLTVSRPGTPTITLPMPQGPGSALWPASGDLLIRWNTAEAGAVEIVLGTTTEGGERVRCLTLDDGEFALPARLAERYRSATAGLEVRTINQVERDVDGFRFRFSYTVSDAIQLFRE